MVHFFFDDCCLVFFFFFYFFFQAEDGIRDKLVTGVQTCALPIFAAFQNKNKQWVPCGGVVKFLTMGKI